LAYSAIPLLQRAVPRATVTQEVICTLSDLMLTEEPDFAEEAFLRLSEGFLNPDRGSAGEISALSLPNV
jgi:hypothetical protein